jgi:hypothetical protein
LSTIGCFVITSTVRDGVDKKFFVRVVFIGTCFVWLILILIGLLFRAIINFTNPQEIDGLFHRELIKEAAENLKSNLFKTYSLQQLKTFMEEHGALEYSVMSALAFGDDDRRREIKGKNINPPYKILYDINMQALEEYIAKRPEETFYYLPWALDDLVTKKADLIWPQTEGECVLEKAPLRNCVVRKKIPVLSKDKVEVRKYFDQKLEDAVAENKFRNAEKILESYIELYKLDIRNDPHHD